MKLKIKINDHIVSRKVKFMPFGNFVMNVVRYHNKEYLVGEGDEYIRGYDEVYTLGRCLID